MVPLSGYILAKKLTKLQHVPVPSVGGGDGVALRKIPLFSIHYYSNVKPNSGSVVVELGL